MTTRSRLMLSVAAMCCGLALAPAAYAQGMSKEGSAMSNSTGDKMTSPDTMGKTDAMGKTDTMAKPGDKTDAMKKDEMSDKKKDGMSGGMTK